MSWSHIWVVTLAEQFFLVSLIVFIFAKVTIFLSEKVHLNSKQTTFQVFYCKIAKFHHQKILLLRLLRGPMKSTTKLESQNHSVYIPHTPCQWMYSKLFSFFFSLLGFSSLEVSCFLLPGQLPTLPLLFMHFL